MLWNRKTDIYYTQDELVCIHYVRGARGVMVIMVESRLGYSNSNLERDCLHFTLS